MAREIDEKIVQMRFENSNFEQGAQQTIRTLNALNKSTDALGVNTAGMDRLVSAIDKVNSQFGVMETIARGALERIGAQAVDAGERLAKSMTVDQVTAGWSKYAEKTRAVKTIMNATGESIGNVNNYLEKLMWYTDETSYNFVDMTSNIGKFTSQGIALDDATTAMMGISNWAAQAGQGVNEASRAMYNLSQAIGVGAVKLQDWMSVENANMGTKAFKELAIETAKELGTLSEAATDAKGKVVTIGNFRESLRNEWFTSDVLIATLKKYGDYSEEVYKLVQEEGISASEAMERLGESYGGVGKAAFEAAQISKTFSDALDATADAASSRWMAIFETMFGNLEQQEKFWTDVTYYMYDAFVGGLDGVVEALKEWEGLDGSLYFLYALDTAMQSVVGIIQIFGNAWEKAFGSLTGDLFMDLTFGLIALVELLAPTEETLDDLSSILSAFMSTIGVVAKYVVALAKGFTPLLDLLNLTSGTLLGFVANGADVVTTFMQWISSESALNAVTETTRTVVQGLVDGIKILAGIVGAIGYAFVDAASMLSFSWENGLAGVDKFVERLKENFDQIFEIVNFQGFDLSGVFGQISTFFTNLSNQVGGPISTIIEKIASFFDSLKNIGQNGSIDWSSMTIAEKTVSALSIVVEEAGKAIDGTTGSLEAFAAWLRQILGPLGVGVREFFDYFTTRLGELSTGDIFDVLLAINVGKLIQPMNDISEAFEKMMMSIVDTLEAYQSKIKADNLLTLAKALGILAASLFVLSKVPIAQLAGATTVLVALGGGLTAFMWGINKITDGWDDDKVARFKEIGKSMLPFVLAIELLAFAAKKLGSLDLAGLAKGVSGVGVLMAELVGFLYLIKDMKLDAASMKSLSALTGVAAAINLLVRPIKKLGSLDLKTLAKGLAGVGAALLELAAFSAIVGMTGGGKSVAAAAVGMVPLVAALALMVPVVKLFSGIPWETLGVGLAKFGAALAVVAAGMIALSFAGTAGLAASVGLAALAAAFALLLPQMALVAMFEWESIGKILTVFIGVLGAFTVASLALSAVGPIFVGVGAAIAAFNISVAAIIAALALLAKSLPLAVAGFVAFSTLSEETITNGTRNIGLLLEGLIDVIIGLKTKLKTAFMQYLLGIVEAIAEIAPDIANGALLIVTEFLAVLDERLPEIMVILDDLLTDLEPYAHKFGEHGAKIAGGFVKGVIDGLWSLFDDTVLKVGEWLDGVFMGGQGKARKAQLDNYYKEQGKIVNKQIVENVKSQSNTFAAEAARNRAKIEKSGWMDGKAYLMGNDDAMGRHSPETEIIDRQDSTSDTWLSRTIHNLSKWTSSGSSQADAYVKGMKEKLGIGVPEAANDSSKTFSDTVEKSDAGGKAARSIAKQMKKEKSIEDVAKEKAEKVAKVFEDALKDIDLRMSVSGSKYDIAEAYLGPDAKEKDKQLLQLKGMQEELQILADEYKTQYQKYQNLQQVPNIARETLMSAYNDYIASYKELAQKANEIGTLQKELYGSYEEADKKVFNELVELGKAKQSLVNSTKVEMSKETQEAYDNYVTAATTEQKQYYYDLWQQLRQMDAEKVFGDIIAKPIDPNAVKQEVYKQIGLDPNNPMEAFTSVADIVNQAVGAAKNVYTQSVMENAPAIVQEYETQLAQSADEVIEFVEETTAPDFKVCGQKMAEATADGIEISASKVSYQGKTMSKGAAQETRQTEGEWVDVGIGMMQGVIDGIKEMRSQVINAAVEVAEAALLAAKQAMGIASPSKEFYAIGMFMMDGMRIGILSGEDENVQAARDVSNIVVDQFSDINSRMQRVMDDSLHPIIEPRLDMSGVKRAAKNLDSIWSSTTLRTISDISMSELSRRDELLDFRKPVAPVVQNENNFVQNNYSPKSLTDAEIYMQTKKEFDWAFKKGATR